jgi:hypothetical protein
LQNDFATGRKACMSLFPVAISIFGFTPDPVMDVEIS